MRPTFDAALYLLRIAFLAAHITDYRILKESLRRYIDIYRKLLDAPVSCDQLLSLRALNKEAMKFLTPAALTEATAGTYPVLDRLGGGGEPFRASGLAMLNLSVNCLLFKMNELGEGELGHSLAEHVSFLRTTRDYAAIIDTYNYVVSVFSEHPIGANVALERARFYRDDLSQLKGAAIAYRDLYNQFPSAPEAAQARIENVQCLLNLGEFEEAYFVLNQIVEMDCDDSRVGLATYLLALTEILWDDQEGGQREFRALARSHANSQSGVRAAFWTYITNLANHNYRGALSKLEDIQRLYPESPLKGYAEVHINSILQPATH